MAEWYSNKHDTTSSFKDKTNQPNNKWKNEPTIKQAVVGHFTSIIHIYAIFLHVPLFIVSICLADTCLKFLLYIRLIYSLEYVRFFYISYSHVPAYSLSSVKFFITTLWSFEVKYLCILWGNETQMTAISLLTLTDCIVAFETWQWCLNWLLTLLLPYVACDIFWDTY